MQLQKPGQRNQHALEPAEHGNRTVVPRDGDLAGDAFTKGMISNYGRS